MSERYGDVPPDRHEEMDDIDALLAHDERRRIWAGWWWLLAIVIVGLIIWWIAAASTAPNYADLNPGGGRPARGGSGDSSDQNVRMTSLPAAARPGLALPPRT